MPRKKRGARKTAAQTSRRPSTTARITPRPTPGPSATPRRTATSKTPSVKRPSPSVQPSPGMTNQVVIARNQAYLMSHKFLIKGILKANKKVAILQSVLLYLENVMTTQKEFYTVLQSVKNNGTRKLCQIADLYLAYKSCKNMIGLLPRPRTVLYRKYYRIFFETVQTCYRITLRILARARRNLRNNPTARGYVIDGLCVAWNDLQRYLQTKSVEHIKTGLQAERQFLLTFRR